MTTNRALPPAVLALLVGATTPGARGAPPAPDLVGRYREHLATLADVEMEGRLPGELGAEMAAAYIEGVFTLLGLEPAFPEAAAAPDGTEVITPRATYRQPMELGADARVTAAVVSIAGEVLTMNQDFTVLGLSASGAFDGPCVFVGYSIAYGPDGYLGYNVSTDLSGKAALMLRFEPMDADGTSRWADEGWTRLSQLTSKVREARRRGAAAAIVVTPEGVLDERADRLADTAETLEGQGDFDIPVIMVTPEIADRIVAAGDPLHRSLAELKALADEDRTIVELPEVEVQISITIERDPLTTDNLGAVLPGRGPLRDEYIVIGGHYDHIGRGEWGAMDPARAGEIHPGADDNASGAAGVLLAAEIIRDHYARLPEGQPARSVLFLPFTAEESGLDGSRHYLENPIVPVESHAALLNMDMVGRMRDGFVVIAGVGSGEGLEQVVEPRVTASGLAVMTAPGIESGRSDHANFDAKKIPFLHFTSGPHDEYHTPDDTLETINAEGAVRIVELLTDIALDLATREPELAYTGDRHRQSIAVRRRQGDPDSPASSGPRVRVGLAVDARAFEPGVRVRAVSPGSAAEEAGLRAGDRITSWNGQDVADAQAWARLLLEHEPGETIEVRVIRDGAEVTRELRLKGVGEE